MALAITSVHMLVVVGAAILTSKNMDMCYSVRQDVIDTLARTPRRGLAAGQELRVEGRGSCGFAGGCGCGCASAQGGGTSDRICPSYQRMDICFQRSA